ncbi:DNA ligase 1 [Culex quinquefasciatus]|uniref:DNA ligase 1 n=1 Tax=Culex quinquefasciatus TaxID=7176 RepID=B0XI68_CULQU|nr:DNA ligase 1 [Culex quinquefasciatus]|eukprot:XP_001869340.1 DNA ligase 1 [Culex quinquefasciatus]
MSVCFCYFDTSAVCSAGKKPKLEASSTDELAAGTQFDEVELCRSVRRKHRESQKSPSDSMPRGGEKYTKKRIVKVYQGLCRVHGSSKLAEKKKKRELSESPKRRLTRFVTSAKKMRLRRRKSETVTCLARTFQIIEKTSERLPMIKILANYFWSVILSPDDLLASTTADQSKSSHRMMFRPAPLSVKDVFGKLRKIIKMTVTDDGQDLVDVCGGLTRFASVEKLPKAKVEDVALVLKTVH